MKKDQLDLDNGTVWIPDSKTANGVAEVPLTEIAIEAFRSQLAICGSGPYLFRTERSNGQAFLTFAFTIFARRTQTGSVLGALRTCGSRSCFDKEMLRCSRSTRR